MSLSHDEALQSLHDATEAQRHSREVYGYSLSAPYFFTWGLVWMAGYAGDAFDPRHAHAIWSAVLLAGIAATFLIGRSQRQRTARGNGRIWAMFAVVYAFSFGLFSIVRMNEFQVGAYWPLLTAAAYGVVGIWMGMRYVAIGAVLFLATLGAYHFLQDYFFLWMAVVGGGSLLLTGLWMRQA